MGGINRKLSGYGKWVGKVVVEEKQVVVMPTEEAILGRTECGKERGYRVFIWAYGVGDSWGHPCSDTHNTTGNRSEPLIWLLLFGAEHLTDTEAPTDGVREKNL